MPDNSLLLDTCALRDMSFMKWLKDYNGEIAIPSVVYMERCRQYLEQGLRIEDLDKLLNNLSIKVLSFNKDNARQAAELMHGRKKEPCEGCGNIDWTDTIVASYLYKRDLIITNNKKDFPTSGGFDGKVLTTDEIMNQAYRSKKR